MKSLDFDRGFFIFKFWQTFCHNKTSMKSMKLFFVSGVALFVCAFSFGQLPANKLIVSTDILAHKKVVFQRIVQQYITNENQYILDAKSDTTYLIFNRDSIDKLMYHAAYFTDPLGKNRFTNTNAIEKKSLKIKFNKKGKITQLLNWKEFRDEFMSGFSVNVRANQMTSEEFDLNKKRVNNEAVIRRMAMEDIGYMFSLNGDTFVEDVEYLRVKAVRDPFSSEDMQLLGNLKMTKPVGTQNTIVFNAVNKAGPKEKQLLMEECREYLEKNNTDKTAQTELKGVSLNSEQEFTYNIAQKRMLKVTLSDILVINFQSRGNIRYFTLFDFD